MSLTAAELETRIPHGQEPYSDEPQMESSQHWAQLALLVDCLEFLWRDRQDFFVGANLSVYYNEETPHHRAFIGPDFFLVNHTQHRPRRSWAVWLEGGRYPDLIIELLSPDTAATDRTRKKRFYQDTFRTPEYFWFSPFTLEFAGFTWTAQGYREIPADHRGWRYSQELGLYLGVDAEQLRYFTPEGDKVPTSAEAAEQAQGQAARAQREAQHAQQEAQHAQQEAQHAQREAQQEVEHAQREAQEAQRRAERLAERLRAAGIDPDT
jgi:Uma2 family endonuclease